jgi:hypothetical protein
MEVKLLLHDWCVFRRLHKVDCAIAVSLIIISLSAVSDDATVASHDQSPAPVVVCVFVFLVVHCGLPILRAQDTIDETPSGRL